jgi:hypothetical protein
MEIRLGGEIQSFGGIEDFLTTRITKEHKDGHVFLVFVVCVCFVVEQGFSRKEARENAKRKMEVGGRSFGLFSAVCFQDFLFSTPWGGSNAGAGSIKLKIICKSG